MEGIEKLREERSAKPEIENKKQETDRNAEKDGIGELWTIRIEGVKRRMKCKARIAKQGIKSCRQRQTRRRQSSNTEDKPKERERERGHEKEIKEKSKRRTKTEIKKLAIHIFSLPFPFALFSFLNFFQISGKKDQGPTEGQRKK